MANTKISGLSSASTPLSGSEILPLNQSGTTDSVTVNNFTNGRSVGMSQANITNNGSLIKLNYAADGGSNLISWINTSSTTLWDMGGGITIRQDEFTIRRQGTNVIYCDNNYNVAFSSGNLVQGTAGKGINFTANTPASGMTSQLLNWYEQGTFTPTDGSGAGLSLTNNSSFYTRIGRQVTIYCDVTYPSTTSASPMLITGIPFAVYMLTDGIGSIGYTTYVPISQIFLQLSAALIGIRIFTNGGSTLSNATVSTQRFQMIATFFTQ